MSRYDSINDPALWSVIVDIQNELESGFRKAAGTRHLSLLGDLVPSLKKMYWAAAFLGATQLADVAIGGAEYLEQLQQLGARWSREHGEAVHIILKRTRAFCSARPGEPSGGVFTDADGAVLPGPELRRPIPVDDILDIYRRRQIDIGRLSACRQLSFGRDPNFSHAITVPSFATSGHRPGRNLTLVYLDLEDQGLSVAGLTGILAAARSDGDILLHGPLAIPWDNYRGYDGKRPYYLLLDSLPPAEQWMKNHKLKGRTVKKLREAPVAPAAADNLPQSPTAPIPAAVPEPGIRETRIVIKQETQPAIAVPQPKVEVKLTERSRRQRRRDRRVLRRKANIAFPIAPKMILVVSIILLAALSVSTLAFVIVMRTEKETELEINETSVQNILDNQVVSEMDRLSYSANLLFNIGRSSEDRTLINNFFRTEPSLIYVGIPDTPFQYTDGDWLADNNIFDPSAVFGSLIDARWDDIEQATSGADVIFNASPFIPNLKNPVLGMAVSITLGTDIYPLLIIFDTGESLAPSVKGNRGAGTTVIVNTAGELLAHPDLNEVLNGRNILGDEAFEKLFSPDSGTSLAGIHNYVQDTPDGPRAYIGYYRPTNRYNLGIITTVPRELAFQSIRQMVQTMLNLAIATLALGIFAVIIFARSLTNPILDLYEATDQLLRQNWDIQVDPKTRDEVAALGNNFNNMVTNTADLIHYTSLFVNPAVAEMIYHQDERLEHPRKEDVTVFFSDIRGFTQKSERMGDPQIIVDNLRGYFEAMVPCVTDTKGTVDKFIGDAIMAVWNDTSDIEALEDWENPDKHPVRAVDCALQMRAALINFNLNRSADNDLRPKFPIGCGIHSGEVTIGTVKGLYKWDWTHIGPTVNETARLEAMTSQLGVDILISEETKRRTEGIYDVVPCGEMKAKGVSDKMKIYAVLGRMNDAYRPKSIEEVQSLTGLKPKGGGGGKVELG